MTQYWKYIDIQMIFHSYQYNGDKDGDGFRDELHDIIDNYICCEDEDIVKKIVHKYDVFKAIKDYTCEYGEFDIDPNLSFMKTHGTNILLMTIFERICLSLLIFWKRII